MIKCEIKKAALQIKKCLMQHILESFRRFRNILLPKPLKNTIWNFE